MGKILLTAKSGLNTIYRYNPGSTPYLHIRREAFRGGQPSAVVIEQASPCTDHGRAVRVRGGDLQRRLRLRGLLHPHAAGYGPDQEPDGHAAGCVRRGFAGLLRPRWLAGRPLLFPQADHPGDARHRRHRLLLRDLPQLSRGAGPARLLGCDHRPGVLERLDPRHAELGAERLAGAGFRLPGGRAGAFWHPRVLCPARRIHLDGQHPNGAIDRDFQLVGGHLRVRRGGLVLTRRRFAFEPNRARSPGAQGRLEGGSPGPAHAGRMADRHRHQCYQQRLLGDLLLHAVCVRGLSAERRRRRPHQRRPKLAESDCPVCVRLRC